MKKLNKKRLGVLYGVLLFSFSTYALLDTFVIPHPMQSVMASNVVAQTTSSSIKESVEAAIQEKLTGNSTGNTSTADNNLTSGSTTDENTGTTSSTSLTSAETVEGGTVIGEYSDSNTSITLKQYRAYDSDIYVADVTVSDVSVLKTALANNTYGRNITDTTSNMAEENNAVLAINGDYYGARQAGYVIRNGNLYRNTSGDRDALVITKTGEFEFVSENKTSAEELLQSGAYQVLSFGPVLLDDGEISVGENDEVGMAMASNPRTAIGYLGNNHYVFVVSDGRTSESAGLSLYELATFMKELGVVDAYNLDGGGSSTMVFKGEIINNPTTNGHSNQERAVSDIVYIGGEN
ncbi:periplasmic protein, PF09992 family [Lachnoanaerobaculum sp. MSX33]|uniref:phosphodiester glycosidase family protein n=1 Tax=Lachnoanaerobaculum sp. MSX33 TaxID=936596 RepID=UPI0003DF9773|nr:phosphodiester glycosidase family protein [Lachnoanaerobaculum sp. MSX33]ETO99302.1 periplasmic protein, PF09992 family [Lachnoanaerobaculum sp. MSX33]